MPISTTNFCIPSFIYNTLTGLRNKPTVQGGVGAAGVFVSGSE